MYFANPWGLLALLSVPTILAIHLFQRRFPPLEIAGLHLWSAETQLDLPGRKRDRLPWTATLLLELLAGLLLSLTLADPRWGELNRVAHLVVVLDGSASMSSQPPGGEPSLANQALAIVKSRLDSLPRGSVLTVISSGERPVMLAGPAVSWDQAQPKLEAWKPNAPRHRFDPAWDLGLQLLQEDGELIFITDLLPDATKQDLPGRIEMISVGRKMDNLAIDATRWTFDSITGKGRIFARIKNLGATEQKGQLVGTRGEQRVLQQEFTLPAGQGESLEFEVPGGLGTLRLAVEAPADALPLDSVAYLAEPQTRRVSVSVNLPGGDDGAVVLKALKSLPDVQMSSTAEAHLVIAPAGNVPKDPVAGGDARRWWLGIGPIDPSEAARMAAKSLVGPFLLERSHPLLEGLQLGGVIWGGVQAIPYRHTPLISSGNTPLLVRLIGNAAPSILLNIDLAKSNLPESPDWPILLANLIELRRQELPGLARWNYRLGETVRFRLYETEQDPLTPEQGALTLITPTTTKPLVRGPTVELTSTEQTGWYVIQQGGQDWGRFAMNFVDAEESDLKLLAPGRKAATVPVSTGAIQLDASYSWVIFGCLLLILLCILGDWFVLRPRPRR